PVNQIARVVNLHAGEPLERGRRDVVIVADAQDGGVRIETRQNGIPDHAHCASTGSRRSRTRLQRTIAPSTSNSARHTKNGAYPTVETKPPMSSENNSSPALPNVPAIPAAVATSFLRNRSEAIVITVTESV